MQNKGIIAQIKESGVVHYYDKNSFSMEDLKKAFEKDKYFTPSIEDIRVGYKCEVKYLDGWRKFIVENSFDFNEIWDIDNEGKRITDVRVPYLTKEQIEAEGWEFVTKMTDPNPPRNAFEDVYIKKFKDGYYQLHYSYNHQCSISIWNCEDINKPYSRTLYRGECKDINTFRYITKLLGI